MKAGQGDLDVAPQGAQYDALNVVAVTTSEVKEEGAVVGHTTFF